MTDFQIVPEGPDDSEWLPDDQARFSGKRKLSAAMEVIPTEPPDLFHMRHSDELDRAVVDIVRGSDVRLVDPIGPFSAIFILGWDSAPPIGLAFDFFAEVNGRIVPISQRSIPNEKYRVELIENAGRLPEHVTIILRASKAAALRTPDLFEIWDGELWFENIPVLPRGSSPGDYYRAQVRRMNPAEQYPPCEADKWHGPLGEWPIDDPNEAQDTSASAIVQQLLGLGGTRDAGHRDHNAAQRVDHAAQEQLGRISVVCPKQRDGPFSMSTCNSLSACGRKSSRIGGSKSRSALIAHHPARSRPGSLKFAPAITRLSHAALLVNSAASSPVCSGR